MSLVTHEQMMIRSILFHSIQENMRDCSFKSFHDIGEPVLDFLFDHCADQLEESSMYIENLSLMDDHLEKERDMSCVLIERDEIMFGGWTLT